MRTRTMGWLVPIAISVGVGLLLTSWLGLGSSRASQPVRAPERQAPASAAQASLRRQVEALGGEVAALRDRVRDTEAELAAPAADPRAEEPSSPPVPEQRALSIDQYYAFIARRFAAETRDASWREAAVLAPKLIAILPSGSRLRSLDCRASLCKVETTHLDLERYREFLSAGFSLETQIWSGAASFPTPAPPEPGQPVVATSWLMKALPPPPPGSEHLTQPRAKAAAVRQ